MAAVKKSYDAWREAVAKALRATDSDLYYTPESILDDCKNQRKQLWVFGESIVITEILVYPTGWRELNVFLYSGREEDYPEALNSILLYARAQGCDTFAGSGRAGWTRLAKKHLGEVTETRRIVRRLYHA